LASIILGPFVGLILGLAHGGVVAHYASDGLYQLHLLVVRSQPEVDASRAAQ
jgi:hypothetical protein